jgi:hypothetical protein
LFPAPNSKILALLAKSAHSRKMQQRPRIVTKIVRLIPVPYLATAALLLLAVAASYFV